jgi:hypothetical protein
MLPNASADNKSVITTFCSISVKCELRVDTDNSCNGACCVSCYSYGMLSFGICPCTTCLPTGQAIGSQRNCCTRGVCHYPGNNKFGLDFYTGFHKRMSITNSGKVGIGTSTPSSTLEVAGSISGVESSCGIAVYGLASSTTAANYGVRGVTCSTKGHGVCGTATKACAVGVRGVVCNPCAIPIVAKGVSSQVADMIQVKKGCSIVSVVNKCGWLGVGTSAPVSALNVVGCAHVTGQIFATCFHDSACVVVGCATGSSGGKGVSGRSFSTCGFGVFGKAFAKGGVGVGGFVGDACAIPIVAGGYVCQSADLQQWRNGSCIPISVVSKSGWLGIGTSTPSTPLDAVGTTPQIGTFKSVATSGDRTSLVQFANGDATAVDWNLGVAGLCNSIKIPDGNFYVQRSTSASPAISVNKCNNHVGIGIANPCRVLCVNGRIHTQCGMGLGTQTINTTLAINGSLSMKSRQVSMTTTVALSDYAIFANATSSSFVVTLPSVASTAGACNGMIVFIKKIDSSVNTVTVSAASGDTIEGVDTKVLTKQYDVLQLISNNSNSGHEWFILSGIKCGVAVS